MASILFVESNFTGIDALRSASQAGFKCYLLTSSFQTMKAMLPSEIFDGIEQLAEIVTLEDTNNVDQIVNFARSLPELPVAVISFSQFRILTTARAAQILGLAGNNPSSLELALDKYALRKAMQEAGLPSIKFLSLRRETTVEEVFRSVGVPCIFKPSRGHSSLGVKHITNDDELRRTLKEVQSRCQDGEMIAEEFLEGPLFSLETLTTGQNSHFSWGYTDRELTHDFIEVGASFPSHTPDDLEGIKLVFGALSVIGFDFGACHTELIFTSKGPRIVEVNPRAGGSGVGRLVGRATMHDVVGDIVKLYAGDSIATSWPHLKTVSMKAVLPHHYGKILSLPNRSDILELNGVRDVWFQRKIGDLTDESRSNFSWLLTVLTESHGGKSSLENAESAVRWIESRILVEEPKVDVLTKSS